MFGWGGSGGRVYQKAYVEFFASEALLDEVLAACASRPELNYYAVGYTQPRGCVCVFFGLLPTFQEQ